MRGKAEKREDARHKIELNEASAFALLIDHVERVDLPLSRRSSRSKAQARRHYALNQYVLIVVGGTTRVACSCTM